MVTTLPCGCTLDTDFVQAEHRPGGPPFHLQLTAKPPPPPPKTLPEEEATEDRPKKRR